MGSTEGSFTLTDLGEAMSAAFDLGSQFKRGNAAALLGEEGCVRDFTVFAGLTHDEDFALDWAESIVRTDPLVRFLLLFTVVAEWQDELREDDIRRFDDMRRSFGLMGVEVVDWLVTDGENVRTMSFAVGARTWEDGALPLLDRG